MDTDPVGDTGLVDGDLERGDVLEIRREDGDGAEEPIEADESV